MLSIPIIGAARPEDWTILPAGTPTKYYVYRFRDGHWRFVNSIGVILDCLVHHDGSGQPALRLFPSNPHSAAEAVLIVAGLPN